jgi:hypothetical protein
MARNLTINGNVSGPNGNISGASITVRDMFNGGTQVGNTQTDGGGNYGITVSLQTDAQNRVKCKVTVSKTRFISKSSTRTTGQSSLPSTVSARLRSYPMTKRHSAF